VDTIQQLNRAMPEDTTFEITAPDASPMPVSTNEAISSLFALVQQHNPNALPFSHIQQNMIWRTVESYQKSTQLFRSAGKACALGTALAIYTGGCLIKLRDELLSEFEKSKCLRLSDNDDNEEDEEDGCLVSRGISDNTSRKKLGDWTKLLGIPKQTASRYMRVCQTTIYKARALFNGPTAEQKRSSKVFAQLFELNKEAPWEAFFHPGFFDFLIDEGRQAGIGEIVHVITEGKPQSGLVKEYKILPSKGKGSGKQRGTYERTTVMSSAMVGKKIKNLPLLQKEQNAIASARDLAVLASQDSEGVKILSKMARMILDQLHIINCDAQNYQQQAAELELKVILKGFEDAKWNLGRIDFLG
jgi:hypothetical protein